MSGLAYNALTRIVEWCNCGHSQYWPQESDEEKLRKQLEKAETEARAARAREQMARNNEKSARHGQAIVRGKLKAQFERIKNGVCPCCNRSFANVRRHMATKHPEALAKIDNAEPAGGGK